MGTLTDCVKDSCVRDDTYKVLVEPTDIRLAENEDIDQSQDIDKKKPQDISMHNFTVSEKSKFAFVTGF